MVKEKIINWNPINSKPTIEKDDDFVVGDSGVNNIVLKVDPQFDTYQAQMVLSRLNSDEGYLDLQVVTNGQATFTIPQEYIMMGVNVVYFRLSNNGKVAASCGYKYTISCGKIYSVIKVNSDDINDLIEELKEATTEASNMKNLLTVTTNSANQINNQLETTINEGNNLETQLSKTNVDAENNLSNLNAANSTADQKIISLRVENASAQGNIENLGNSNSSAFHNIRSLTTQNANATNNINDLNTSNATATSNIQNLTIENSEATTNLQNLQDKINEVPAKITAIETAGTTQVENVNTAGTAQIDAIKNTGTPSILNKNTSDYFTEWLGTKTEYDAIGSKTANRRYSIYSDTGAITEQYFWKWKEPKEYFDNRISMVFQGGENGYYMYNDPSDPMPINTLNNSGLKVWEETEDYFIYIDKDAVTTRVEKYVVGSYQTFLERKADVEGNMELVKSYTTWTQEDDSNLFIRCNNEALEKLARTPSLIPETVEEVPPPVLEPRAVPTSYNCCFRVDRKTGEIYIDEGYENYTKEPTGDFINIENGFKQISGQVSTSGHLPEHIDLELKFDLKTCGSFVSVDNKTQSNLFRQLKDDKNYSKIFNTSTIHTFPIIFYNQGGVDGFEVTNLSLLPPNKPFVKTIMPNGKLSFTTNATSETHTFIAKGENTTYSTTGTEINLYGNEKLKQFLVYKGLLTSEEVQVENARPVLLK